MSHLRVLICRVEDASKPEEMTELHRFDLGHVHHEKLESDTALDQLEMHVSDCARLIERRLLESQWEEVDEQLAGSYQQAFPPWGGDP